MILHTGNVADLITTTEFLDFPYVRRPLENPELAQWQQQGYTHKHFAGEMYGYPDPMPAWCNDVATALHIADPGFVFYKMTTGVIMPTHVDHFNTYTARFDVEWKDECRGLVMLEDWKPGHYLEMLGHGIVNWQRGDYYVWTADTPHAAANIGIDDRYTLQITGTKIQ